MNSMYHFTEHKNKYLKSWQYETAWILYSNWLKAGCMKFHAHPYSMSDKKIYIHNILKYLVVF
jgi:hypothetical protein